MKNVLELYREELAKEETALKPLEKKIAELTEEKNIRFGSIERLRWLIFAKSPKGQAQGVVVDQPSLLSQPKNAKDAFKQIVTTRFKDKFFKEADVRKIATDEGLLVRGKEISKGYARNLFKLLQEDGVIEKTDEQGTYKTKAQVLSDRLDKAMGAK